MADATIAPDAAAALHLLEPATGLEHSLLWQLQSAFYRQQGVKCWLDNTVPSFVTSNAFIANAYARVLLAYLRDWFASGRADRSQPVYIVEVGAGHGKLAFLLLRELMEAWQAWPDLGQDAEAALGSTLLPVSCASSAGQESAFVPGPHGASTTAGAAAAYRQPRLSGSGVRTFGHGPGGRRAPFRLVITDSCPSLLSWWAGHESLRPYVEAGVLDFACWDACPQGQGQGEEDGSITLTVATAEDGSPLVLRPCSLSNPVLGVANYCLNSLPQAVVRVSQGGHVEYGQATLYSERAEDGQAVRAWKAAAAAGGGAGAGAGGAESAPGELDASMIMRTRVVWSFVPLTTGQQQDAGAAAAVPGTLPIQQALPDPLLASIVQAYAARTAMIEGSAATGGTVLTLPVGGMTAMRRLSSLSSTGQLFLLAGDKGYAHEEELVVQGGRYPHIALHGSLSCMVNFHALRLATLAGGAGQGQGQQRGPDGTPLPGAFSLHTPFIDGFKVGAYWWDGQAAAARAKAAAKAKAGGQGQAGGGSAFRPVVAGDASFLDPQALWDASAESLPSSALSAWPETTFTWADSMDTFGPDNFATLQRALAEEVAAPSLKLALATLRMSCWDPDVAFKFKQTLIDMAPAAGERLQADLYSDVAAVYARYYPLSPAKDLAFELGRVCMGLRRHHEAIGMFWASVRHTGEHQVTLYNIGICLFHLGQDMLPGAHAAFARSLHLKPDYQDARTWKERVEGRMAELGMATGAGKGGATAAADGAPAAVAIPVAATQPEQVRVHVEGAAASGGDHGHHGHSHAAGGHHGHSHSHGHGHSHGN